VQTLFSATGPGNVDKIILDFAWNDYPNNRPLPQESVLTFTIDGGSPMAVPVGMFMFTDGYVTVDAADATNDVFISKNLGVMTAQQGALGGFRRINIPYHSSITVTLTIANPSSPAGTNLILYSNFDYYPGAAPAGRYPATQNVFHMVCNDWATSTIAPSAVLNMLPSISGTGQLDSIFFVSSAPGGSGIVPNWLEPTPIVIADGSDTYVANGCEDFFFNNFYGSQFHARCDEGGIGRYFTSGSADGTTLYWTGYRFFRDSPLLFNSTLSAYWQNLPATGFGAYATKVGSLVIYYTES
jgi:hypothetical protein